MPIDRKRILAYHSIGDRVAEAGAGLYCVTEAQFRQQMEYIKVHSPQSTVHRSIILTFDDGDMTNYTKAFPILKEYGMKAYFFIIGEWVGKPGYMGWREIEELKSCGMTIGSHGMTHRLLTALSDEELDRELQQSKRILEERLKSPVNSISIPRGFCNKKVLGLAKAAGYNRVFTSEERIVVRANWNMKHFVDALNGKRSFTESLWNSVKDSSRKLLGDKNYDTLRTRILK